MFVHESGPINGEIILFLHGNGASGAMWRQHFKYLKDFNCLAPDFPGFGKSNQEKWISLEDTADKIIDLIDKSNYKKVNLVGLSLGSGVAFTLLGKRPDLFNHVIIDGAGLQGTPALPLVKIGFYLMEPFLHTEFLIKTIANSIKINPANYSEFRTDMLQMSPSAFRRAFIQALSLKQPQGLENFPGSVLFVCGEKELAGVKKSNQILANLMPHAASRIAPKVGHGWLAEKPELHYRMVEAWLTDKPLPSELINNLCEDNK